MMDLRVVMASSVGGGGGGNVYGLSSRARLAPAPFLAVTRSVERGSLLGEGGYARRASSAAALRVSRESYADAGLHLYERVGSL